MDTETHSVTSKNGFFFLEPTITETKHLLPPIRQSDQVRGTSHS